MIEILISVLEEFYENKSKDIVIEFLKLEKRFYELVRSESLTEQDILELLILAKFLNYRKESFPYSKNRALKKDDFFFSLGINSLLTNSRIPKPYWKIIQNQELSSIKSKSIQVAFKTVYDIFNLANHIYMNNGDIGLTKYISINNKMLKFRNKTLFDLFCLKLLDIEDVVYITSDVSSFAKYTSSEVANKIFELKLANKKEILTRNSTEIIYL